MVQKHKTTRRNTHVVDLILDFRLFVLPAKHKKKTLNDFGSVLLIIWRGLITQTHHLRYIHTDHTLLKFCMKFHDFISYEM